MNSSSSISSEILEFKFSEQSMENATISLALMAEQMKFIEQYYDARPYPHGDRATLANFFKTLAVEHKDNSQIENAISFLNFDAKHTAIFDYELIFNQKKVKLDSPNKKVTQEEFKDHKNALLEFLKSQPRAILNNVYRTYFQRQYMHYANGYPSQSRQSNPISMTPTLTALLESFKSLAPDAKHGISEFCKRIDKDYVLDDVQAFHLVCAIFVGRGLLEPKSSPPKFKSMPYKNKQAMGVLMKELAGLFTEQLIARNDQERRQQSAKAEKEKKEAQAKADAERREKERRETQLRTEAEAKKQAEAKEQARREEALRKEKEAAAREQARREEAQRKAKEEADREQAKKEAELKAQAALEAKVAEKIKAQIEAETRQREAELRAKIEAETKQREAELRAKIEAESKQREAELRAKIEAETRQREAELRAKIEAETRERFEAELRAQQKTVTPEDSKGMATQEIIQALGNPPRTLNTSAKYQLLMAAYINNQNLGTDFLRFRDEMIKDEESTTPANENSQPAVNSSAVVDLPETLEENTEVTFHF